MRGGGWGTPRPYFFCSFELRKNFHKTLLLRDKLGLDFYTSHQNLGATKDELLALSVTPSLRGQFGTLDQTLYKGAA